MKIFEFCKGKNDRYSSKRVMGTYLGILGGIEKMILFSAYLICGLINSNKINTEIFDKLDSSANWLITSSLIALGSTLFEKKVSKQNEPDK